MELVPALASKAEKPPLTAARLRRQLTVERAARIARLTPEEVMWLEEGRLYRFPSTDSALLALLLYSTALGINRREARRLAGLPLVALPQRNKVRQLTGVVIAAVILVTGAVAFVVPSAMHGARKPSAISDTSLPPSWKV